MNISVFEVTGPVMIGPSSSHTAGAARLAGVARLLAGESFSKVTFGLHGSFAKTYKGHGTDKALVAGVLGIKADDERLASSFGLADEAGLAFEFYETELNDVHENSAVMTFFLDSGKTCEVVGSSTGGGSIQICRLNGREIEFTAQLPTLLVFHKDRRGIVSEISHVLAVCGINIAVMKLSREYKGDIAHCVIETDHPISDKALQEILVVSDVIAAQAINIDPVEE